MNDPFTNDLEARLSAFVENVSVETLSAAFEKANFEGYRHLKGSFFGIISGTFDKGLNVKPFSFEISWPS